jgi:hypothetical protein
MRTTDIVNLTLILEPDIPYFAQVFGPERRSNPPVLAERLQVTLADFELLWNLPRSFAAAGLPLPAFAWPAAAHRAYRRCSEPGYFDEDLDMAYELQLPEHEQDRDLIRGLLPTDATDESIAELFQYRPGVIADFHELWWNVRDRRSAGLYMAGLLVGRHSDFACKLLRVGSLTGKASLVLLAADLPNAGCQGLTDENVMQQIEEFLVTEAAVGQQLKYITKRNNPALALVEEFLLDSEAPVKELDILTQLSMNKSAQALFKQLFQKQSQELLEAGRNALGKEEPNAILALIKAAKPASL